MDSKRSTIWFAIFTVVVMLGAAAGGVLLDRHLFRSRFGGGDGGPIVASSKGAGRPRGGPGPGRGAMTPGRGMAGPAIAERMVEELRLTPAQAEDLRTILDTRRAAIEKVRAEMRQRMEAEQRMLQDQIRGILQPEQKKRFDEMMASAPVPLPGMRGGGMPPTGLPGMGRGGGRGERPQEGAPPPVR